MATLLELMAKVAKAEASKTSALKAQVMRMQAPRAQVAKARAPKSSFPDVFWERKKDSFNPKRDRTKLYVLGRPRYWRPGDEERTIWFADEAAFEIMDKKTWDQAWDDGYNIEKHVDGDRWVGVVFWNDDTRRNVYFFSSEAGAKHGMEKLAALFLADLDLSRENAQRVFSKVLGAGPEAPTLDAKVRARYAKVRAHAQRGVENQRDNARVIMEKMEAEFPGLR